MRQYFIIVVTVITVGLWCAEKALEDWVGSIGMVALLPVVVFFGTGLLTTSGLSAVLCACLLRCGLSTLPLHCRHPPPLPPLFLLL